MPHNACSYIFDCLLLFSRICVDVLFLDISDISFPYYLISIKFSTAIKRPCLTHSPPLTIIISTQRV